MEKQLNELIEMVSFIKDNAVTKEELQKTEAGLLGEIRKSEERVLARVQEAEVRIKGEVTTQMDGFVQLYKRLDVELVSLRSKYERLEEEHNKIKAQLAQVMAHLNLEVA